MSAKKVKPKNLTVKNRRASFEYHFLDKYVAGIVLTGTEIKSIRTGKVSLQEAYCYCLNEELWIKQMHIAPYEHGNIYNHLETRERKLLLHKKELRKLMKNQVEGLTIIPIQLFINEKGLAKVEIALAQGKKLYDKRQAIKERDLDRELQRQRL
jgi:SsrA-binding protein